MGGCDRLSCLLVFPFVCPPADFRIGDFYVYVFVEDLLCCAPLVAEDGVVHLKDDVLGVEVLWCVVAEADLPTLIVRPSAQVESDFNGHGVQGFL